APDPRPGAAGRPLCPDRALAPRPARKPRLGPSGQGFHRAVRADRAAPPGDAHAGRGGSIERRPERGQRGRGRAEAACCRGASGVDGNIRSSYSDGGQTHTEEMTANPWWEVDLGAEFPIDAVVVSNRTDGQLGRRLDNFTLTVLDAGRSVVAQKEGVKAPAG